MTQSLRGESPVFPSVPPRFPRSRGSPALSGSPAWKAHFKGRQRAPGPRAPSAPLPLGSPLASVFPRPPARLPPAGILPFRRIRKYLAQVLYSTYSVKRPTRKELIIVGSLPAGHSELEVLKKTPPAASS